jgi:hypothetical protein
MIEGLAARNRQGQHDALIAKEAATGPGEGSSRELPAATLMRDRSKPPVRWLWPPSLPDDPRK